MVLTILGEAVLGCALFSGVAIILSLRKRAFDRRVSGAGGTMSRGG